MAGTAAENQGWFAYSVLFAVAFAMAIVPLLLQALAAVFFPSSRSVQPDALQSGPEASDSRVSRQQSINTRYFNAVQVGALIALPLLLMLPLVGPHGGGGPHGAWSLIVLCVGGGCGLVYANRKGDLRWDDSLLERSSAEGLPEKGHSK